MNLKHYGRLPETAEENRQELDRMQAQAEEWNLKLQAYTGETCDLNLDLIWHCPRCKDHPRLLIGESVIQNGCAVNKTYRKSKVDKVYRYLYCPAHPEVCEYNFTNKEQRQLTQSWWSDGFKYPLTAIEVHKLRVTYVKSGVEANQSAIRHHEKKIIEGKAKLVELENQLVEAQAMMLG